MSEQNHMRDDAQSEKVPVVWAAFTDSGYVRFWTADKTRAVAEMAAGGINVKPYTVDDLMGMVVRASAAHPPAAPVEPSAWHCPACEAAVVVDDPTPAHECSSAETSGQEG